MDWKADVCYVMNDLHSPLFYFFFFPILLFLSSADVRKPYTQVIFYCGLGISLFFGYRVDSLGKNSVLALIGEIDGFHDDGMYIMFVKDLTKQLSMVFELIVASTV